MRRWRMVDDRVLVEADSTDEAAQFYRLDKKHNVDRVYRDERRVLDGETHSIVFTLLGRQLMCRHTIDKARTVDDQSRVEADKLEPLTPDEEPVERICRDAVAAHRVGAETVDAAKRAQVDKLAAGAPESIRPIVARLAERVVFHDDKVCRQMMGALAKMAKLHRSGGGDPVALRAATDALELAARLMAFDPDARTATLPALPATDAVSLVETLDEMRRQLASSRVPQDNFAGAAGNAAAYDNARAALQVAIAHLFSTVELGSPD